MLNNMCKNKYCFDDTCQGECLQDKRNVVWFGVIPAGMENEMRYPTEEEVDAMIKSIDEEDIDKMLDSIDEQIKKDIKGD